MRMTRYTGFQWRTVIADEATVIKNRERVAWRTLKMQPEDCIGFATAMPAQNRVTDWVVYTHLAYITGDISNVFLMPHDMSYSELRADDFIPSYEAGDPSWITIAGADDNDVVKDLRWCHHKLGFKW
jgi:hypothetical protein